MKTYLRLEIISHDRIGMVLDILKKLYENNISIHSLEVFPNKVYVKSETLQEEKKSNTIENLLNIDGVLRVHEIELLSYEKNERRLRAIIDAVQDGILAINHRGEIELFNNYCEKIFHRKKENIVGKNIKELLGFDGPIINLLKSGKNYDNIEVLTKDAKDGFHYITSGRSVKDDRGKTIAAVASLKDINEALEMSNVITSKEEFAFKDIIGSSPSIIKTKKICTSVAKSNSTILLRGESGTGKELFARAIHKLSSRADKNFTAINCATLPDNLIESELFGYVKGSFTGAAENGKDGLFKAANNGTLFLDEIGELSLPLQAKLLRVLQEGTIRKIGSTVEEKIDVRIIAATNRNLEDMIKKNTFREDLYYRLNVIPIYIHGYIYSRLGNPTCSEAEDKLALLEGGEAAVSTSSGMGAISAALWTALKAGDHVVASDTLYGCTFSLLNHGLTRFGVDVTFVDATNIEDLKKALKPNTKVVYLETPANPTLKINDIKKISAAAHKNNRDCLVFVDNTFCTPYIQRPLELGADVVVHSATKYLNGHGDVIAGFAVGKKEFIDQVKLFGLKDMTGAVLSPFDAYLIIRGMKTLPIRMEKHCENAMEVAKFLESHPAVSKVYYPGLESFEYHDLAKSQMKLPGAMISFELKGGVAEGALVMNSLKLATLAVSLGDAETLIEHPASMTHSPYSAEERHAAGISDGLVRLSVGLENAEDIIDDLKQALDLIAK